MGIRINVNARQDYSYLFQGLSAGSGGMGNLNFLSDYASIKNGSYGKLMKAYYAKDSGKEVSAMAQKKAESNTSIARDSAKTLSEIESAADGLKGSADKLISKSSNSVFRKVDVESTDENGQTTTSKEYDKKAIYDAVSDFVKSYNTMITEGKDASSKSVQNKMKSLIGLTQANQNLLSKVGISINEDKTLALDEKQFMASQMDTAKTLFNGNQSYAYRVSAQSSLIDFAAQTEASKAGTYNASGSYNNSYLAGSIYDYGF